MWIVISGILVFLCIVLFLYIKALKKEMRNIEKELALTKEMSYNRQLRVSLFDKDLTKLVSQINENLSYQKELKFQSVEAEDKWKQSVSDIAHDLRTPLTVVKGNLQLLQKENLGKKEQTYVALCLEKAETLKNMVDDFFELSVLESDSSKVLLEEVDMTALLIQFILEHEALIKEHNLELDLQLPEKKVMVYVNKPLMQRMLSNLLGNVMKYAKESFRITMKADKKECEIVFANPIEKDNPLDETQLFCRTYRGERARSGAGAGLGLYIVALLSKKQGAEVFAKKTTGELHIGIRFQIKEKN